MTEHSVWPETTFRCNGGGGCVIVEELSGMFVIRDSKNPYQPGLVFSRREYRAFRQRVIGPSRLQAVIRISKAALLNVVTAARVIFKAVLLRVACAVLARLLG